jgi:vitamin B12 transporter
MPQAAMYLKMFDYLRLRGSVARSSRPPTYTELFYEDPVSKGNKDLSMEKAISYEAGIDFSPSDKDRWNISLTVFRRDIDHMIDWIKYPEGEDVYQAENIKQLLTEGLELEFIFQLQCLKVRSGYAYIYSDTKNTERYISKYALNYPGHKVFSQAEILLPFGTQSLNLLYKNKKRYSSYFLMGCVLRYDINKNSGIFVKVENIFNTKYWDIRDNTLPGRQIAAGFKIRF